MMPSFVHNPGEGMLKACFRIIGTIMAGLSRSEPLWKAPLLGCAFAAAIVGTLTPGAFHAGAQDTGQSVAEPTFEVASVKLHVTGSGGGRSDPGRFVGTFSIAVLIMMAYGPLADQQLVGPEWIDTAFLDVNAKMPEGAAKEQIPRMLKTLLADRLKLTVHQESRIMPVYKLTVGKAGPKMKEVDPSKFINEIVLSPLSRGFRGRLTMPILADLLSQSLDRYVLDSTGLKAIYDLDLQWTPDEASALPGAGEAPQPLSLTSDRPNLFLAIQQQLGLKLESGRAPVKVVVVDHVERVPTAN
jgi:uncharacterized protein (TIGR03435 family)